MLIDLDVTIAYKCFSCGSFDFATINLFTLFVQHSFTSKCRCKGAEIRILKASRNEFKLTVPCIGCGAEHAYTISREELINKNIKVYSCPVTGIKQCFIGSDDAVRNHIDSFEKELDVIIDGYGYDNYFANTQVMIDTLNRIHDIAEQGRLYCECGNEDIIATMLKKGIILQCSHCSGSELIPASSNSDLKKTLQKKSILLKVKKSESIL